MSKKKVKEFTLVQSESCDWYVVPVEKADQFRDEELNDEGVVPDYATYVERPERVVFTEWKERT